MPAQNDGSRARPRGWRLAGISLATLLVAWTVGTAMKAYETALEWLLTKAAGAIGMSVPPLQPPPPLTLEAMAWLVGGVAGLFALAWLIVRWSETARAALHRRVAAHIDAMIGSGNRAGPVLFSDDGKVVQFVVLDVPPTGALTGFAMSPEPGSTIGRKRVRCRITGPTLQNEAANLSGPVQLTIQCSRTIGGAAARTGRSIAIDAGNALGGIGGAILSSAAVVTGAVADATAITNEELSGMVDRWKFDVLKPYIEGERVDCPLPPLLKIDHVRVSEPIAGHPVPVVYTYVADAKWTHDRNMQMWRAQILTLRPETQQYLWQTIIAG